MAETAKMKVFTYDNLVLYDELLKNKMSEEDAKSLKTVAFVEGTDKYTIKFYKVTEPVGETAPAYEVSIPKTDVSGFISKITGAVAGDVVTANADGTVADSGVKLADLATKAEVKDLADGAVKTNTDAIAVLNGDATKEGSVAKAVKDSSDAINATIGTVAEGKTVVQMIADAQTSTESKIGDISTLNTTAKTDVVSAVNELITSIDEVGSVGEITIDTTTTTEGYLKSYTIKQGGVTIGVVDIPKDLVVQEGSVVVNPENQPEGTYIKLVIANQTEPLYINVGTLVDIYVAKSNATQVQIAIDSSTREISATIVAGSIGTTELANNAIVTTKIADANVTLAKLAQDAKDAFDAAGSASTAETNAKTYADGLNTAMDTRVDSLESKVGEGFVAITEAEINALFTTPTA